MGKRKEVVVMDAFDEWFNEQFGTNWPSLTNSYKKMNIAKSLGFEANKGDYPELTDQLLEAEAEARKEVGNA